jgi:hypothetical protein
MGTFELRGDFEVRDAFLMCIGICLIQESDNAAAVVYYVFRYNYKKV